MRTDPLRFTAGTTDDGVQTRHFTLGEVPGVHWTPAGTPPPDPGARPLILLVHGGGQHKLAPGVLARARRFAAAGWTAAAIDAPGCGDRPASPHEDRFVADVRAALAAGEPAGPLLAAYNADLADRAVPEWRAALDALLELGPTGPVGVWGLSMGGAIGLPLAAADPRVRAAVLGTVAPHATLTEAARRITVPVEYLVQWDDEFVPREASLALFDALASTDKSLQANPGPHAAVPRHRPAADELFFRRCLAGPAG